MQQPKHDYESEHDTALIVHCPGCNRNEYCALPHTIHICQYCGFEYKVIR